MAVPSSGELSLKGIVNELDDNDYTSNSFAGAMSLKEASDGTQETINTQNSSSDRPDGSAPHAMSEFYSYDHDYSSWNNNTDWYNAAINTGFWGTYSKFRIDFGYSASYNGTGTVNEVTSWGHDSDIISGASFTPSTSATTPGYITCDGSADCVHSWDEGAITNLTNPAAGGGTLIMVWFKKHTSHNGTLFSISDNSSNVLLEMNTISSGAMQTRVMRTNGVWQTRTSTTSIVPNNVWKCYVASFDTYSGGKGVVYRITCYVGAENLGNWTAMNDGYGDCIDGVAFETETAPYGIGCIPNSSSSGANVFDGDIALVTIMKGIHYGDDATGSDAKLNGWIADTHEKMGL